MINFSGLEIGKLNQLTVDDVLKINELINNFDESLLREKEKLHQSFSNERIEFNKKLAEQDIKIDNIISEKYAVIKQFVDEYYPYEKKLIFVLKDEISKNNKKDIDDLINLNREINIMSNSKRRILKFLLRLFYIKLF